MRLLFLSFILCACSSALAQSGQAAGSASFADSVWLTGLQKERTEYTRFLTQNKGKVIYLDLWASWCRPCAAEMPASKALKEKLAGTDVVFLYISVDEEFQPWQRSAERFGLTENSYFLNDARQSSLIRKLELTSIPRYVVIGKDGKVVKRDAPRPSQSGTYDYLLKLSQKK